MPEEVERPLLNRSGINKNGGDDSKANEPRAVVPRFAFVVEIANSRNGSVMWPINQTVLRGRWARANVPSASFPERLERMPDIPGMHIAIDTSRGVGKIFDPLSLPTHKDLLEAINVSHQGAFGTVGGPERSIEVRQMSDDVIKTWLYWVRRMMDSKDCICREGLVPSMEAIIKLPGAYATNVFDASIHIPKAVEKPMYPYVVPTIEDQQKRQADLIRDEGTPFEQAFGVQEADYDDDADL